MKYIDVLFISSMEYNIYISTGRRLTSATSHIVLNAIEYIFKNECDVQIFDVWCSAGLLVCWSAGLPGLLVASFLASFLALLGSLPVRHNAIPMECLF